MTVSKKVKNKQRVSKFELLRIIAMFLIVLHHSIIHGVFAVGINNEINYPVNTIVSTILGMGGRIGVYLFVLVTGYFMIYSHITLAKIIKLWLPIFFWSILLYSFVGIMINNEFSIKNIITSFFPIIFNQYWFMTVYVFMYCLIPFLNVLVNNINNEKKKIYFLFLGFVIIFTQISNNLFGGMGAIGSNLLAFSFMYCIGAMIRNDNLLENKLFVRKSNLYTIIIWALNILIISTLILFGSELNNTKLINLAQKFAFTPATLLILFEAIGLFVWIGSKNISYHSFVNKVASVTFGIYLISDNSYVREWLWNTILHMNKMINQNLIVIVVYTIVSSLLVFIICGCLEYLRKIIFGRIENILSNNVETVLLKKLDTISNIRI